MTENLFKIDPVLRFPIGKVFEVPDQYNGHQRGTFYFRSNFTGGLRGPFLTEEQANHHLSNDDMSYGDGA